jgi:hypothetical protein
MAGMRIPMRMTLAAAMFIIPTMAAAGFYDGNKLHQACHESLSTVTGYLAGWYDTRDLDIKRTRAAAKKTSDPGGTITLHILATDMGGGICLPENATLGQITDVVCKYLKDNPTMRHFTASSLTDIALREAFPCK